MIDSLVNPSWESLVARGSYLLIIPFRSIKCHDTKIRSFFQRELEAYTTSNLYKKELKKKTTFLVTYRQAKLFKACVFLLETCFIQFVTLRTPYAGNAIAVTS